MWIRQRRRCMWGRRMGRIDFRMGLLLEKVASPFICFGMVSADGRALVGSGDLAKKILVTAKFDSRNSDFALNTADVRQGESSGWGWQLERCAGGGDYQPWACAGDYRSACVHDRFPDSNQRKTIGMILRCGRCRARPFREMGVTPRMIIFLQLKLTGRGNAVETPASATPKADDALAPGESQMLERPDASMAGYLYAAAVFGMGAGVRCGV